MFKKSSKIIATALVSVFTSNVAFASGDICISDPKADIEKLQNDVTQTHKEYNAQYSDHKYLAARLDLLHACNDLVPHPVSIGKCLRGMEGVSEIFGNLDAEKIKSFNTRLEALKTTEPCSNYQIAQSGLTYQPS